MTPKTAEEILKSEFYKSEWDELMAHLNTDITPSIVAAMKKYAQQEVSVIENEIKQLNRSNNRTI